MPLFIQNIRFKQGAIQNISSFLTIAFVSNDRPNRLIYYSNQLGPELVLVKKKKKNSLTKRHF